MRQLNRTTGPENVDVVLEYTCKFYYYYVLVSREGALVNCVKLYLVSQSSVHVPVSARDCRFNDCAPAYTLNRGFTSILLIS